MQKQPDEQPQLDPETHDFYCRTLETLTDAGLPFLVGGAFAFRHHTGIVRDTKDLDVFIRRSDCKLALRALRAAGYHTDLTFPHWLAKAFSGDHFVDLIFRSGNGLAEVDDSWFDRAIDGEVLGIRCKLCAAEEIIWTKALIMERERYDGADVAHLLHAGAEQIDWPRLLALFGPYWRPLLSHLILFGFIYPAERTRIPADLMRDLLGRVQNELTSAPPDERLCQGTLLSREQYLIDIEQWGYTDARLRPHGSMTPEDMAHWTAAIDSEE
jgi:hypothetical protein